MCGWPVSICLTIAVHEVIQIYEGSGLNFILENICGVDCKCRDTDFLLDFSIKAELSCPLKRQAHITCLITFGVLLFLNETHQKCNELGSDLSAALDVS